jgi:hypothetical protein
MESTITLSTPELSEVVPKPTFQYATELSRPFAALADQRINIIDARIGRPAESNRAVASNSGLRATAAHATDAMRQFIAGDAANGTPPSISATSVAGHTGRSGPSCLQSRAPTLATTVCASRSAPTHATKPHETSMNTLSKILCIATPEERGASPSQISGPRQARANLIYNPAFSKELLRATSHRIPNPTVTTESAPTRWATTLA